MVPAPVMVPDPHTVPRHITRLGQAEPTPRRPTENKP